MRARLPDREGVVDRDGVKVAYELFEHEGPTLLLIPPSAITHGRVWKGIAATLARHFRVLVTDGLGTGRSDRPLDPQRHGPAEVDADLCALLDAEHVEVAVVVAHCHAVPWALRLAADHPDRVLGIVAICPEIDVAPDHDHWDPQLAPPGWDLHDTSLWRTEGGYRKWIEFFFDQQLPEPHSTKQHEDAVGWALDTDAEAKIAGDAGLGAPTAEEAEQLCAALRCPMLVIHGSTDL